MSIAAVPLHRLVQTTFEHARVPPEEARLVADHLVDANLMGHDSHGVIRVQPYIGLLRDGRTTTGKGVRITKDAGALITVDGQEGLGQVVCKQAMDLAIERARAHGVAVLGLCNTTHMGRIGAWAEQAAAAGMVSLHFCNTTGFGIQVAPFGGTDRRLSVNPIALGVPRKGREPIIHDMSTGTIAAGKIRVARNKGSRLPEGSLIDNRGLPTTDPEAFFADPPGAITTAAAHKGYGLAMFVEILAGSLTAGGSSHPDNPTADRAINNLLSILIDPGAWPVLPPWPPTSTGWSPGSRDRRRRARAARCCCPARSSAAPATSAARTASRSTRTRWPRCAPPRPRSACRRTTIARGIVEV